MRKKKRSFKQRTKVELAQVLERMKERLRDPRDKRKDICVEAGMNQHAAAKFFKVRTGLTMGEYRAQHYDLERIAGIVSRQ